VIRRGAQSLGCRPAVAAPRKRRINRNSDSSGTTCPRSTGWAAVGPLARRAKAAKRLPGDRVLRTAHRLLGSAAILDAGCPYGGRCAPRFASDGPTRRATRLRDPSTGDISGSRCSARQRRRGQLLHRRGNGRRCSARTSRPAPKRPSHATAAPKRPSHATAAPKRPGHATDAASASKRSSRANNPAGAQMRCSRAYSRAGALNRVGRHPSPGAVERTRPPGDRPGVLSGARGGRARSRRPRTGPAPTRRG
jgi:hypothetical protein